MVVRRLAGGWSAVGGQVPYSRLTREHRYEKSLKTAEKENACAVVEAESCPWWAAGSARRSGGAAQMRAGRNWAGKTCLDRLPNHVLAGSVGTEADQQILLLGV